MGHVVTAKNSWIAIQVSLIHVNTLIQWIIYIYDDNDDDDNDDDDDDGGGGGDEDDDDDDDGDDDDDDEEAGFLGGHMECGHRVRQTGKEEGGHKKVHLNK